MALISAKRNNPQGWVNLGKIAKELDITIPKQYESTNLLLEILSDGEIETIRKKYIHETPIESEKRNGQPMKSVEVDNVGMANHLCNYIHNCENLMVMSPITEEAWTALAPDQRIPEEYPTRTKKFFTFVPVEFNRERIKDIVKTDLLYVIGTIFISKAALKNSVEEWEYEGDVKN